MKLDFSRQRLTQSDLEGLFKVADEKDLLGVHARMIRGECVNGSEGRSTLHTSLRSFSLSAPRYAEVAQERRRLFDFAQKVRDGRWLGCRGDRIVDVINIGIGGSEMGPRAVWHALRTANPDIHLHFLATVDGVLLDRILSACNPRSTLVIVSSKSFTTRETQVNATAVDQWLLDAVTPRRLGAVMAMYEHKTTMLGTLYGINPFDQPGVELGKRLSRFVASGGDPQEFIARETVTS